MSNPHQTAIIRKAILANLNAKGKDLDREISAALENGQTLRITDEFGDPLGTIVKTNPSMDPVIDSPAEAFGYISGLNPDYVDYKLPDPAKSPEKYFDAVDALLEAGRGDLLTPTIEADSQKVVINAVKEHYRKTGELPPGWKFPETPEGTLRITPSKEAKARAAELLSTNETLRALTGVPTPPPADVIDADN